MQNECGMMGFQNLENLFQQPDELWKLLNNHFQGGNITHKLNN